MRIGDKVVVTGMRLQCEECGEPIDTASLLDRRGHIGVQPCGHTMQINVEEWS